ncbi:DctP family TRAP transporter solute-binding subunit [Paenibacillus filicis]|uniref:DctP family TRAP transporter solute-binding subunit n=1 Tax=Paenibacillus gyeongsangnamensis TaxID=3388067 RepID=A0ABT4QLE9_9BACL|nr:DctP family TRAP transporter solute-binding subunit [Paenibacillus filicis]MCZ8517692.1 DctP family TRAP transporter solute-binding subunit [Paenibacillus filicis]
MKPVLGTILFVLLGLTAAAGIGFYPTLSMAPIVKDDEQTGFDQELVIKFSHVVAENTPKGLAASHFAQRVKETTGGRVKVEVFPNGVLYTESDEFEALMRGNVQMIAPSFSNVSEVVPAFALWDLPFAFRGNEAILEAFSGEIGKRLFDKLGAKNTVGLAYWGNGFRQITSNRGPIVHPSDFQGLKFRILPSKVIETYFHALDVKTVPIPFNDVYRALESGSVDGEENSISNINSKKFYQVQKYMTLSDHSYLGYAVLMNKSYWDRIPADLKEQIMDAMRETTSWANQNAIRMNQEQLIEIERRRDIRITTLSPEEKAEWIRVWNALYPQFEGIIGRDLMASIRKLQQKYGG